MTASPTPLLLPDDLRVRLDVILKTIDNNERRVVEAEVVHSLSNPQTLTSLVTILCDMSSNTSSGVRQLAAVLLRKKIFSLWRSLTREQQNELGQLLLAQLGREEIRAVRIAVAHIVTRLAKADAIEEAGNGSSNGGWIQLQQAIRAAVEDTRVENRELAMILAYSIAEVFAEENSLADLVVEAVIRGMKDSEEIVVNAAVKAACSLLPFLEGKPKLRDQFLHELVTQCLHLLMMFSGQKEKVTICFRVLDLVEQMIMNMTAKKHSAMLVSLATNLLVLAENKENTPRVRENSCGALAQLVLLKPKFITSHHLLENLLGVCLNLMAEDATISFPNTENVEFDEDSSNNGDAQDKEVDSNDSFDQNDMLHVNPPCMYGGQLLSVLASNVPSKTFTAALIPQITAVTDNANADPLFKKAAIIALACLGKGNPSYLRRRVSYVLQVLRQYMEDASPVVREAAAYSLSYFALSLQPEVLSHHGEIFPMLVPLLSDSIDAVRRRVAGALDTLCENLSEDLEPYVEVLLPAVMQAIPISTMETQTELCKVISSMAMTRCPSFKANALSCLELLREPMTMSTPETVLLRARATEAVGIIANALGKDQFEPFFPYFMERVSENFQSTHPQLREQSFGFLANICEALKIDFLPYLDDSLACALKAIETDRAVYKNEHLLAEGGGAVSKCFSKSKDDLFIKEDQMNAHNPDSELIDDDDDDDDDDAEDIVMRVREADMEEKCSAVYCIAVFADNLLANFGEERIKRCWDVLSTIDDHIYGNIRSNVFIALAQLTKASHGVPAEQVQKSFDQDTLSITTRDMVNDLVQEVLLPVFSHEADKEIVSGACEALEILLNYFGPQLFPFGVDSFAIVVFQLLRQRTLCQRLSVGSDDDSSDGDDGQQIDSKTFPSKSKSIAKKGNDDDIFFDTKNPKFDADNMIGSISVAALLRGVKLEEDHDNELMDAACEMISAFAKAYGERFYPYFCKMFPLLMLYADLESRPEEDIIMSTGCIAECIQALGSTCFATETEENSALFDTLMNYTINVIQTSEESVILSNSAFLVRALIEVAPAKFANAAAVSQTLQLLWQVAGSAEEIPQAIDNAVSATCSLVRCIPIALIPINEVVPSLLKLLPMRVDHLENENATRCLNYLLTTQAECVATAPWIGQLVECLARILSTRSVEEKIKQDLLTNGALLFASQYPSNWVTAKSSLSPEIQTVLSSFGL